MAETKCKRGFQSHVMCDCEPTHPITPREKVELKPCPFCGGEAEVFSMADRIGVRCADVMCAGSHRLPSAGEDAAEAWNRRAALASSGDHAELARAIDRLLPITIQNTPDYAEVSFGECRAQAMTMEPGTWLALNQLPALIAEVAALREQVKFEKQVAYDENDRWQEAERKLAEAVGLNDRAAELMRQCTDPKRFEGASTLNVYANMRAWLSDISKEAERG